MDAVKPEKLPLSPPCAEDVANAACTTHTLNGQLSRKAEILDVHDQEVHAVARPGSTGEERMTAQ